MRARCAVSRYQPRRTDTRKVGALAPGRPTECFNVRHRRGLMALCGRRPQMVCFVRGAPPRSAKLVCSANGSGGNESPAVPALKRLQIFQRVATKVVREAQARSKVVDASTSTEKGVGNSWCAKHRTLPLSWCCAACGLGVVASAAFALDTDRRSAHASALATCVFLLQQNSTMCGALGRSACACGAVQADRAGRRVQAEQHEHVVAGRHGHRKLHA